MAALLNSSVYSQWFSQSSGTSAFLRDVFFIDINTGWATGYNGTVLKTTNGGSNWISSANGITSDDLTSIHFVNNSVGWISGQNLNVFKSTNGGLVWLPQVIPSTFNSDLTSLFFVDVNTGWTVANYEYSPNLYDGYIYRSTNGGTTWDLSEFVMDERIYCLYFLNNNVGWALGTTLLKTTNGGNTWEYRMTNSDDPITPEYYSVFFINENVGWLTGENTSGFGQIHKSTNGGASWIIVHQDSFNVFKSVYFVNENTGWCTGESGTILYTTDGGTNWSNQVTNSNELLNSVFFSTNSTGWVVGSNGTILKTVNAGTPVELISFTAEIINNTVLLNWSTATEINNSGFEVERKTENSNWGKINFVPGYGTTAEPHQYIFTDKNISPGNYLYRLKQVDFDGTSEYSKVIEVKFNLLHKFDLSDNYPNPFNPSTSIQYAIGSRQFVQLKVYDVLGNEIITLVNEYKPAGTYEVEFDGIDLPSGFYFYTVRAGDFSKTKKMILMK